MRVHVVHAHPVETSLNRAIFDIAVAALKGAGHEVDPCNLYDEGFEAAMSREERLNYHEVPDNITPEIAPYVERLRAAEALVFIYPVWNYGFPAILKGYFDRIFIPGVAFEMSEGGDRGEVKHCLNNIRKVAFITSYGGDRLRTMIMGDPPRRIVRRWAWATFRTLTPPIYMALYDMNNVTEAGRKAFVEKVRRRLARF
jgi:putative NADPH-quinone reductase